jgi:iron(III) transport system substrate-binding protein
MRSSNRFASRVSRTLVLASLLLLACAPGARPATPSAPAPAAGAPAASPAAPSANDPSTMSLDDLHRLALAEGGTLLLWSTLNTDNAAILLPTFERRFPGITVDHVQQSGDKLVARAISESRGGKVQADNLQGTIDYLRQVNEQRLLAPVAVPEAAGYPDTMKGAYWLATDTNSLIIAWNTNLVRDDEAPKWFEDLANPRWADKMIGDPRETELLVGLTRKYGSEERAVELLRQIAANHPEFHRGHSELSAFLAAGQGAICFACHPTQYAALQKRGAPVNYVLNEGVGKTAGVGIFKDAPHPLTALLWFRWMTSEEGQQAMADSGRAPAHPNVAPVDRLRPDTIYPIAEADYASFPRYERTFKEIFGLR